MRLDLWPRLWLALAIALLLSATVPGFQVAHLDVDEGYNLSVVTTLLDDGRYGTKQLTGIREFNSAITTGPVVMLPIAGVAKVLGPTKGAARLVPLLYFWALAAVATALMWWGFGPVAGCVALTAIGLSGYVTGLSVRVLGEAAGLFYLFVGIWAAARGVEEERPAWWALAFGMSVAAVLCKFQYLLAGVPALALTVALLFQRRPRALWPLASIGGGLAAGVVVWIGVQWLSIGGAETLERLAEMRSFSSTIQPGGPITNMVLVRTLMPLPLFLAIAAWSVWHLKRAWRDPLSLQLIVFALSWFGWFVFLDKQPYARHAYPAVVIFFMLFGAMVASAWEATARLDRRPWRLAARVSLVVAVAGLFGVRAIRNQQPVAGPEGGRWRDEAVMADYIRSHVPADGALFGFEYVIPWSMGYLTHRAVERFPPYERLALTPSPYLLVTMGEDYWFKPFREARTELVFRAGTHRLYRIRPGALVAPNSLNRPQALDGAVTLAGGPSQAARGEAIAVPIRLANGGKAAWLSTTADRQGEVHLLAGWDGAEATPVLALDADVLPGGGLTRTIRLSAPATPGRHVLALRLESTGVRSFGRPVQAPFEVK